MTIKYGVTKCFGFEASHKLNLDYTSPCAKFHGHSYNVEVSIESVQLDQNGMVMDFSELKPIKQWVDENWDHATIMAKSDPDVEKYINDKNFKLYLSDTMNITAEQMCLELLGVIETHIQNSGKKFHEHITGIKIAIWETANNKATLRTKY